MSAPNNSNPAGNPTIRIENATGIEPPRRGTPPTKRRPKRPTSDFLTDLGKLTERAKRSKPQ
jgi:hypothetical protein